MAYAEEAAFSPADASLSPNMAAIKSAVDSIR
jgi:tetrahydromethanopterin S-methyltransferase subunit F